MAVSDAVPYDERGHVLIAIIAVTLALALSLLGFRLHVRMRITKNPGLDDFFIVLAMVGETKML